MGISVYALGQRRHTDDDDAQPVEKVFAELAAGYFAGNVLIGRGQNTHIHVDVAVAADARYLALRNTRSTFACAGRDISPISSRNNVPLWACSNLPLRCLTAEVKAPFS